MNSTSTIQDWVFLFSFWKMRLNNQIFLEVESLLASSVTQILYMKSFFMKFVLGFAKNILSYHSVSCSDDCLTNRKVLGSSWAQNL